MVVVEMAVRVSRRVEMAVRVSQGDSSRAGLACLSGSTASNLPYLTHPNDRTNTHPKQRTLELSGSSRFLWSWWYMSDSPVSTKKRFLDT